MNKIKVSLRPMDDFCHVRVEGGQNAKWLRRRLEKQGVEISDVTKLEGTAGYVLHIKYHPNLRHANIKDLLEGIPEVELQGVA